VSEERQLAEQIQRLAADQRVLFERAEQAAAAWNLASDLLGVVNLMEQHRKNIDEQIALLVQRVTALERRLTEIAPPERGPETRH
jgi:hypothetical protein